MTQFEALGLSTPVLKSIAALGFDQPTPIQQKAIPIVLEGKDVMGLAQTGTGKTAAFGLPLVNHLLATRGKPAPKTARSLILAPTRELVNQIAENLKLFTKGTPLRVECVVGGAPINRQIRNLGRGTDILVATPGRLLDIVDRKAVFLDTATFLVLDEADQMLDLGFIHSLRKIAKLLNTGRQTMLFSATMPRQIEELSRAYLTDPVRVETAPSGRAADKVTQCVHFVEKSGKAALLKTCLAERPGDLSLVFSRTKHGAEKLMKQLVAAGLPAASIHGNKSQSQRERAIKAFKSGKTRILVATDVAARGIDIPGVTHVYNFDLPEVAENYVHRIGRTARAGAEGEAIAFCSSEEIGLLRSVEKLMRVSIKVESGDAPAESRGARNGRGRSFSRNKKPAGKRQRAQRAPQGQKSDRDARQNAKSGASADKPGRGNFKKRRRSRKNFAAA
ncbi:DEAD/DEAH box helicase [Hyphococcus sp.]|uniref:DEAD/DEAH box helicase n=1 Tax=Hyphococcus sp. TaxID=2038636 RepID=UPI003CCC0447